jgi:hypothetical protein
MGEKNEIYRQFLELKRQNLVSTKLPIDKMGLSITKMDFNARIWI